ncbi:MAG: hypothetical protein ACREGR_01045 [Minisyncoccia bacterium]
MQKTNWILYRNTHTNHHDIGANESKEQIYPVRSLFRPVNHNDALELKPGNHLWLRFYPHGKLAKEKPCVIGFKRVEITTTRRYKHGIVLNYRMFGSPEEQPVVIREGATANDVYTLTDEGGLEAAAHDKAIYIGPCDRRA